MAEHDGAQCGDSGIPESQPFASTIPSRYPEVLNGLAASVCPSCLGEDREKYDLEASSMQPTHREDAARQGELYGPKQVEAKALKYDLLIQAFNEIQKFAGPFHPSDVPTRFRSCEQTVTQQIGSSREDQLYAQPDNQPDCQWIPSASGVPPKHRSLPVQWIRQSIAKMTADIVNLRILVNHELDDPTDWQLFEGELAKMMQVLNQKVESWKARTDSVVQEEHVRDASDPAHMSLPDWDWRLHDDVDADGHIIYDTASDTISEDEEEEVDLTGPWPVTPRARSI